VMQSHVIDAWGVRLHVEEMGSGTPVVLLHGFTGSTRAMTCIAEGLSDALAIPIERSRLISSAMGAALFPMTSTPIR